MKQEMREDIATRNTSLQGKHISNGISWTICTGYLDVYFVLCFFLALINISDDLKTALQQIKDELKQEIREEHITTRNTSLQGKHANSLL